MKKRTLKIGTLLLALTMITMCFASSTFAKYTATVTGTGTVVAKAFAFDVNDQNAEFTINLVEENETIEPGNFGVFTLVLDNQSDVAVDIAYVATAAGLPLTYTVGTAENDNPAYDVTNANLQTALDTAANAVAAGTTTTVYVYWKWIPGDNDNDYQGQTYNLSIAITADQQVAV